MGIITDPGYELYVGENPCFPEGKTPKKLYATFSGIGIGELWTPDLGWPLNGTYIIETVDGGTWWTPGGSFVTVVLVLAIGYTTIIMHRWDSIQQFNGSGDACLFKFQNLWQGPESSFFCGGFASVTAREDVSCPKSIKKTCNLIGVPPDKKTFAELSLDGDGKQIIRLARQKDGTCIRVKY